MYQFDTETSAVKEIRPGVSAQTYRGAKMQMLQLALEPGGEVETHSHPHEQVCVVLEGEVTYTIAGNPVVARAGEKYLVPGDVEHSLKAHAGAAKVLEIFSPLRDDLQW